MKNGLRAGIILVLILLMTLPVSCSLISRDGGRETPGPTGPGPSLEPSPEPSLDPTPEPAKGTTTVKLRAVGDIIMHMSQVYAGEREDGYDFKPFFEDIKPYLEGADLVIGNLETTISNDERGYHGYPNFKSPEETLEAAKYAGFNILTTANNHSFDAKEFGVVNTIEKLEEYGIKFTGTARSQEERDRILIVEENDIRVGILAYTYGTNGMEVTIPQEKRGYMVNLIDKDLIEADVKRAREEGAEVIVVAMHWGDEYQRQPNSTQKDLADFLVSLGVDIVLGCHPHVLQPIEIRRAQLEDGSEKDVFIIYSLGNFVSNQDWQYSDSGVIIELDIIKDYDQDIIYLDNFGYTPTWVYKFSKGSGYDYRILPVGSFMDGDLNEQAKKRIKEVWNETTSHLGQEDLIIFE